MLLPQLLKLVLGTYLYKVPEERLRLHLVLHILLDVDHRLVKAFKLVDLFLHEFESCQDYLKKDFDTSEEEEIPDKVDSACWHFGDEELNEPGERKQFNLQVYFSKVFTELGQFDGD